MSGFFSAKVSFRRLFAALGVILGVPAGMMVSVGVLFIPLFVLGDTPEAEKSVAATLLGVVGLLIVAAVAYGIGHLGWTLGKDLDTRGPQRRDRG